jgi:hypothetical protein
MLAISAYGKHDAQQHVVDIWLPICAHEMAKAHAATFPARSAWRIKKVR